jgi:hypothetical protein
LAIENLLMAIDPSFANGKFSMANSQLNLPNFYAFRLGFVPRGRRIGSYFWKAALARAHSKAASRPHALCAKRGYAALPQKRTVRGRLLDMRRFLPGAFCRLAGPVGGKKPRDSPFLAAPTDWHPFCCL